ncbi:hypothetical protein [Dethiobacter alkaliphilus]|uniref:Uncharacterized protein n=1 Tax=Dethiobacter alkaliphilus AHT 1 TaxID=555088 RepID=C0GD49_DETAL|nr:hypothetical protein [Dethiobacter alkaliphilus]EEG79134.1 hypothetical protein DealDRAFT_0408 [Dethiobacter alkaliphilus AHT 1]
MTNSRLQALIAEELSQLLFETYQEKHLPQMVKGFGSAGFTRATLVQSPANLFLMLVTATYDRRPFTGAAGGFEYIWGIKDREQGIPARFKAMGLAEPTRVSKMSQSDLQAFLAREYIGDYTLDGVSKVSYAASLLSAAEIVDSLHKRCVQVKSSVDASDFYIELTKVYGIGETIAAKLSKYLLREIAIGEITPIDFPLTVVWPLVMEYHNDQAIKKLRQLGDDVVPLSLGMLLQKGDPFAIDALFYMNRQEPVKLDEFIAEMKQWRRSGRVNRSVVSSKAVPNQDTAKILLGIIRDVCSDINEITASELRGLGKPEQVKSAAARLYSNMAAYASRGEIEQMYRYYQNCLRVKAGKDWDSLLEKIGRKSLRTEWERFQAAYQGTNVHREKVAVNNEQKKEEKITENLCLNCILRKECFDAYLSKDKCSQYKAGPTTQPKHWPAEMEGPYGRKGKHFTSK